MDNDFSKGVDSAVSIITGIITGDMTGGLAGASAPWLAEQIKIQAGDNETARLVAHAILGAVVAELQGNSALSGGVGAVSGELASKIIINTLYGGKDASELTEDEKQTISALSQLASGLAVAAGGGNFGDAGAAINSSKNAVENNFLGHQDQIRLVQLRKKRDESFLTQAEKIEMFILDELDQKGDYLVGKYYKDPNSLTDAEAQQLRYSLTRYYQQVEGMSGEEAARQSINDLLTGNWGYRAHNYDYPYLGYKEQKIEWMDNYFEDKSIFDRILGGRPQSEDEKYFQGEYAWQQYLKATEWEREVGRPVMNFLPGVGWVYNTIDTAQASYELGEVAGRLANGEKFNADMGLKLLNAGFTLAPVAASNVISKGNSTGTIGGAITGSDLLLPGSNIHTTLPNGNNLIHTPNLSGSLVDNLTGTPNVIINGLKSHEIVQAQNIVKDFGGTFEGVPVLKAGEKLNGKVLASPDYPVIDGWFKTTRGENIPISLKELTSSNPLSILQDVSKANRIGKEYGISNSTMFVDAKNMSSNQLIDFARNGPLSGNALKQGVINRVVVRTKDGLITIEHNSIMNGKPVGW